MGLGRLPEACQGYGEVALEHSSKPTKYEPKGPYGDPVYEFLGIRTGQPIIWEHQVQISWSVRSCLGLAKILG